MIANRDKDLQISLGSMVILPRPELAHRATFAALATASEASKVVLVSLMVDDICMERITAAWLASLPLIHEILRARRARRTSLSSAEKAREDDTYGRVLLTGAKSCRSEHGLGMYDYQRRDSQVWI